MTLPQPHPCLIDNAERVMGVCAITKIIRRKKEEQEWEILNRFVESEFSFVSLHRGDGPSQRFPGSPTSLTACKGYTSAKKPYFLSFLQLGTWLSSS